MKHPKWLLIIVLILLVVNIIFYTVWYALDIQGKVRSQLETFLNKTLNGQVTIQKLSINDRHITANDIAFTDKTKNIRLKIKQVQVRYNLLRIILSGFKINKAITQITVYEPNLTLVYDYKPKKEKKPLKIPDLVSYFRTLVIKDGSVDIKFSTTIDTVNATKLNFNERLHDINLTITNRRDSEIALKATSNNGGLVDLSSNLDKGLIKKAKLQLSHYVPSSVQITGIDSISSEISIIAKYDRAKASINQDIDLNSIIWNTGFTYMGYRIHTPYLNVRGNLKQLDYDLRNCKINNSQFNSKGTIYQPLKDVAIKSTAELTKITLTDIDKNLIGTASGTAQISGKLTNISASGRISLPSATYQGETITDLLIDAKYSADSLHFNSNAFGWRNQVGNVSGYFNTKKLLLGGKVRTNPSDLGQKERLDSDLTALVDFSNSGIKAVVDVNSLSFSSPYAVVQNLHGSGKLTVNSQTDKSAIVDLALEDSQGLSLSLNGDLASMQLKSVVSLNGVSTVQYSPLLLKQHINSVISGEIKTDINNKDVTGNFDLVYNMTSPYNLHTDIISDYKYSLDSRTGDISIRTENGVMNDLPFSLNLHSVLERDLLKLTDLNIDDAIFASGWLNLQDNKDFGLQIKADSVEFANYWNKFKTDNSKPPIASIISLNLDYNINHDNKVAGFIKADSFTTKPFKPINSTININGTTKKIDINGNIGSSDTNQLLFQSTVSRNPELSIVANGQFNNFKIEDFLDFEKTRGKLNGAVQWTLRTTQDSKFNSTFSVDMTGNAILFQGFPVDSLQVKIAQLNDLLNVDALKITVGDYFKLSGKGSIDYNVLTNTYSKGNHYLNLAFDGDVLKWINHQSKYIEDAKGRVKCQVVVKASEDGLIAENGFLTLSRGMVKLKDQVEAIKNIEMQCRIVENQLELDKFSLQIGDGKLYIRNAIDPGGDNFYIGPLNLGYFLLRTDDAGLQVTIPDYIPANSVVTAVLKGQNSKEAIIKGPFDDMEIKGEILCSNGSALYPASTNNLMQLMNFFRAKTVPTEVPLPFTLDLMIIIKENVHYVTYPANIKCLPESFLHLTYDGNMWNASEAEFQSEQGTLDFYGSVFNVEFVKLVINLQQKLVALNGTFIRKAPDGTLVTLTVTTNLQKAGDLFNQLEFTLTSDNPEDKSAPQILARLRYNRSMDELSPDQRQSILQDEAMQVIGTSVSTTYISQWLSPVENTVRKFLRLDSFSINTGFIQNLYVQYGTNNQERASFSDPKNLNSDIMQFSSSVFLNNLSLSMGKYLGKGLFLDYQVQMQETTDLARKTKLVFYHDTTLRYSLPWKLRLSYTYSIKPLREPNSHEIMIQRSFRF